MIGMVVQVARSSFESDGRELTQKIRSTIRFMYNQAALTGRVHRMVFTLGGDDSEEQTITLEEADGEFVRTLASVEDEEAASAESEEPVVEEVDPDDPVAQAYADVSFTSPSETSFAAIAGPQRGNKPFTLPRSITLYEVIVPGLPERVTSGSAEMHFYPSGFVDELTLVFGDEQRERFFVMHVNPHTGLSRISRRYPEDDS